jgi:segregation and condensation protein B
MSDHGPTSETEDRALIEAALFLSPQPMTRRSLARILGDVQREYIDRLLSALKREYEREEHGLELHVEEGRFGFRVKTAHIERVQHLAPQQDIPRPVLRTLAVIAYNNPMHQSDLVKVRGNKAYGHVQELLSRGLIRAEESGRTLLLHVTREFLRHFGLSTVEEFRFHVAGLPELEVEPETDEASEDKSTPADGESTTPEGPADDETTFEEVEAENEQPESDLDEDDDAISPKRTPDAEAGPEDEPEDEQEDEPDDGPDDGPPASEGGG